MGLVAVNGDVRVTESFPNEGTFKLKSEEQGVIWRKNVLSKGNRMGKDPEKIRTFKAVWLEY